VKKMLKRHAKRKKKREGEKKEENKETRPKSQKSQKGKRESYAKRSSSSIYHTHTCTSRSGCMTCCSQGSGFQLDNTWETSISQPIVPHISLLGVGDERRQINALVRNPTQWAIREYHFRNLISLKKLAKPLSGGET
jgi:hypothetical protein